MTRPMLAALAVRVALAALRRRVDAPAPAAATAEPTARRPTAAPAKKVDRFDERPRLGDARVPGQARPASGRLGRLQEARGLHQGAAAGRALRGAARAGCATSSARSRARASRSCSPPITTRRTSRTSSAPTTARAGPRRCSSSRAALQRVKRPKNASPIRFVAFDGEEATDDSDFYGTGLRGSKPYAASTRRRSRRSSCSTSSPTRTSRSRATRARTRRCGRPARGRRHVGASAAFPDEQQGEVQDDHTPFVRRGVPSIDLIDFTFECWHQTCDDITAVSKRSLDMSGETVLEFLGPG